MWVFRKIRENNEAYYQIGYFVGSQFIDIYMTDDKHVAIQVVHYLNGGNAVSEGVAMVDMFDNLEPLVTEGR